MPQVVPAPSGAPLPLTTKYVIADTETVRFINFAPGSAKLHQQHIDYIDRIYCEHIINQIDALGFTDSRLTIHPVGYASATGRSDKNKVLSLQRAESVGAAFRVSFDRKKHRSALASKIAVVIEAIDKGDEKAKAAMPPSAEPLPEYIVEKSSNVARAVHLSLRIQHKVVPEDKIVHGRLLLNVSVLPKTVLGSEAFAQWLEKLKTRSPVLGLLLAVSIDIVINEVIYFLKNFVSKEVLPSLEVSAPEIFSIFKAIDFMVPSAIGERYEFKDAKGATRRYNYTGENHRVALDIFDVLSQLLSLCIWLKKSEKSIEAIEKLIGPDGKLNKLPPTTLERLKNLLPHMKRAAVYGRSLRDNLFAKGGVARIVFGDELIDKFLAAVAAEKLEVATAWSQVSFKQDGLFDIGKFGGPATTEVHEIIGQPSILRLEFAAEQGVSLLGFRASLLLQKNWHLGPVLAAGSISTPKFDTKPPFSTNSGTRC